VLSKQTNNLYSAKINTWMRAHYCPGAHTGHTAVCYTNNVKLQKPGGLVSDCIFVCYGPVM